MGHPKEHKLPVIDINPENLKPGTTSWLTTSEEIRRAFEEYGCFIAVYEKVTREFHDTILNTTEELFDLPLDTKMKNESNKPLYGYVGQIPFIPLYESLGIDQPNTKEGVETFTKLMWPNGNPKFSETMEAYSKKMVELEQMVLRMVFDIYGVDQKYMDSYLKSVTYLCRVMKYRQPEDNESNYGFVAHTDKDFVSILHQNQINGLEMQAKDDGQWFIVDQLSSPSSFIVTAGDAFMAWSNGRVHSPFHRVMMNGKTTRYTIAQFSFLDGKVETPEELVDDDHPLLYTPFDHLGYLSYYNMPENRRLENVVALKAYCELQTT
ncbi:probable 2-oxoglutarate-dependent dioxygenase AOP1 [Impatiens glandulifera]|uniref:probable 2-oxoglutarate-dependent dioxygenase AOP1 n=1 Tax=Impatiens glandulifera TaxID=253017 RepID=UPI001FB0CFCF|nr:probable 2-oxoglutarate-dependent dioxygenase AOP1 [Impatiens glandulifera]